MRNAVIQWAVIAALVGLASVPGLGRPVAVVVLGVVALVLLEEAGLLRWLHGSDRSS
jgi:hypothetical protein